MRESNQLTHTVLRLSFDQTCSITKMEGCCPTHPRSVADGQHVLSKPAQFVTQTKVPKGVETFPEIL